MSWTAYRVLFRLLTPMHIGATKLGNLQTARPYVHGKALWGGLTARLVRDNPALSGDYQGIGRQVNEDLAFSYFYPTTSDQMTLWPWDDPDQFAWRYLGSYASTALNYSRFSAEVGSLHETEFIAPVTRDGQPVKLLGHIFEREGCTLPWQEALKRLQLGGERTYGWGRLVPNDISPTTAGLFDRLVLDASGGRPGVSLNAQGCLLAHTLAPDTGDIKVRGRISPLVGRETAVAASHGRNLSRALICWEPGSVVEAGAFFAIGSNGIWEHVP